MTRTFEAEFLEEPGGPEPELRARFAVVASRRLTNLAADGAPYPKPGDAFDFMDAFEGPYVWEMTDAQFEATPPTRVDAEILSVDPAQDIGSGTVHITARVPF